MHEGGISTPLDRALAGGHSQKREGKLEPQPGHLIDIMATCVDVAGAKYPAEFERPKRLSLWRASPCSPPSPAQLAATGPSPIFWEHESNRAVRDGKWKLVAKARQPWELYDMEKDRTEMHNLADADQAQIQSHVC